MVPNPSGAQTAESAEQPSGGDSARGPLVGISVLIHRWRSFETIPGRLWRLRDWTGPGAEDDFLENQGAHRKAGYRLGYGAGGSGSLGTPSNNP